MKLKTRNTLVGAFAAAVVFGSLSLMTQRILRMEEREWQAQAEAGHQESLRLALWRMDSSIAPILAFESARPPKVYAPIFTETTTVNVTATGNRETAEAEFLSPLLINRSEIFKLYFQIFAASGLQSPEVPVRHFTDNVSRLLPGFHPTERAKDALEELRSFATREAIEQALTASAPQSDRSLLVAAIGPKDFPEQQLDRSQGEYQVRQGTLKSQQAFPNSMAFLDLDAESMDQGVRLVPVWLPRKPSGEPELLFVRGIRRSLGICYQGIWVDWPRLKEQMLQKIRDLLPAANLAPVTGSPGPGWRMLASIPAILEPGPVLPLGKQGMTTLRWILLGAWVLVIASFAAMRYAMAATWELSERRGRFVSAVTHELRTPLTTFQLYSQMLADDMVRDEKTRREYLETLHQESERLGRIVENVLLYARVEGHRAKLQKERIEASELLRRVFPRLERRALEGGFQLDADVIQAEGALLETDPQAVEQILFNLIDNSCKYAGQAEDRRLHLQARPGAGGLELLFSDHGPGIPAKDASRVFLPFERGSKELSGGPPGIGLGLTLARAMARELGGDLRIASRGGPGAAFLLSLPPA